MKNKIIGIFCMAPLAALLVFILIKITPVVIERMSENIQGIGFESWVIAGNILAGLIGLILLFRLGWKKFMKEENK